MFEQLGPWSGVKALLVEGRESCFGHALVNEFLAAIVDLGIVLLGHCVQK